MGDKQQSHFANIKSTVVALLRGEGLNLTVMAITTEKKNPAKSCFNIAVKLKYTDEIARVPRGILVRMSTRILKWPKTSDLCSNSLTDHHRTSHVICQTLTMKL